MIAMQEMATNSTLMTSISIFHFPFPFIVISLLYDFIIGLKLVCCLTTTLYFIDNSQYKMYHTW